MGTSKFNFKLTFNYEKEKGADLKALGVKVLYSKIEVSGKIVWILDKPEVKKGVATYTGKQSFSDDGIFHIGLLLDVFKDLGHDFIVTWEAEDSGNDIVNPVVTDYVRLNDDGTLCEIIKPCYGEYTSPASGKPGTIEIYGKKKLWVDIAEGMTFDRFRTDFTFICSYDSRKTLPVTEDASSLDVNDFAKAIGAKILKPVGELDTKNRRMYLQGVTDGALDFEAAKEYLKKYFSYILVLWFSKDAPETAERVSLLNDAKVKELPVFDTPTCGTMRIYMRNKTTTVTCKTFGKDSCANDKDWDFVAGLF